MSPIKQAVLLSTLMTLSLSGHTANLPPTFAAIPAKTVAEGQTISFSVSATDPEGTAVTTTTKFLIPWMSFSNNVFKATPGLSDSGSYTVTFTAKDTAGRAANIAVPITVTNTNQAPVLDAIGAWNVGEGHSLSVPITASDKDGDSLTVTASGLIEPWMSFDGRTLRVRPTSGGHGHYNVTFSVSDGKASDNETAAIAVTLDDAAFPLPWTEYWGSQWKSDNNWAATERSWLGYLTGLNLIDQPAKLYTLVEAVGSRIEERSSIITIEGFGNGGELGSESSGMGDLFDMLRAGNVGTWQSAVMSQVEALAPLDLTASRLIYQLGNEITKETFSTTLRDWANSRGINIPGSSIENDQELIPYYVEYYLAPTVEAARWASLNFYGDANTVNLALGSIGNASNAEAQAFLNALLDYQVEGTYAPSLAGERVYDLVKFITVHYVGSTDNLDLIWDEWQGVGSLQGIWTTEVVGIKAAEAGRGAAKAVYELANHMSWQYQRGYTPDIVRTSLYGWDVGNGVAGTPANESMGVFYDFLGNAALEVETNYATAVVADDGSDLETNQFNPVDDATRRVITVTSVSQDEVSSSLQSVTFNKDGWSGSLTATVHHFSPAGHVVATPVVTEDATTYTLTMDQAINLTGADHAVMITLLADLLPPPGC